MSYEYRVVDLPLVECITPSIHKVDGVQWKVTRMRVPGGWVVTNVIFEVDWPSIGAVTGSQAAVFVPDPDGNWETQVFGYGRILKSFEIDGEKCNEREYHQ